MDDEGEACPSPLLVEKGVLRRFISDYAYQKLLRLPDRGHARLEDFSRIPQPRMFATYVQPGAYPGRRDHRLDPVRRLCPGIRRRRARFPLGPVFFPHPPVLPDRKRAA